MLWAVVIPEMAAGQEPSWKSPMFLQRWRSISSQKWGRRRFHSGQCFQCHHANIINNDPEIHRISIWASPKRETIWVSIFWHFLEKWGRLNNITISLLVYPFVHLRCFFAKDAITATIAGIKATTGAICSKTSVAPENLSKCCHEALRVKRDFDWVVEDLKILSSLSVDNFSMPVLYLLIPFLEY